MKLMKLRLSNFQSFSPGPTEIDLASVTYLLGPNGSGKTAVLQALSRLFGFERSMRTIRRTDFHVLNQREQNRLCASGSKRTLSSLN